MIWLDYTVHSGPNCFTVQGDWPGEVMGFDKDGNPGNKTMPLYQPGDVFGVDQQGWLRKQKMQSGDVLMVNNDGQLIKVAAQTLEES